MLIRRGFRRFCGWSGTLRRVSRILAGTAGEWPATVGGSSRGGETHRPARRDRPSPWEVPPIAETPFEIGGGSSGGSVLSSRGGGPRVSREMDKGEDNASLLLTSLGKRYRIHGITEKTHSAQERAAMRTKAKTTGGKRKGRRLPRFLSHEEAEALLAQVNPKTLTGLRNLAALLLMLRAGLRVSEVVGLQVSDVDLAERRLHVREGKGGKDRTLYLDHQTTATLALWLSRRPNGSRWFLPTVQTGRRGAGQSKAGGQSGVRYLQAMVTRLGRQAGIEKGVSPHVLRHTFATNELGRGVPLHQLQADLGHGDLATTAIYLHVVDPERERSANGRPSMRLPGKIGAVPEARPAGDAGAEALGILEAMGWKRRADGSWLPPEREGP